MLRRGGGGKLPPSFPVGHKGQAWFLWCPGSNCRGTFFSESRHGKCPQCGYQTNKMAERHPLSAKFHSILTEMGKLHDKKQADYGSNDDPFANVRATEDFGQPAWVGAAIRANDKMKRIQKAARGGEMANEAVIDSFMDLAVYAVIMRVLYEESNDVPND